MEEISNLLHDLQSLNEDYKSIHSTKILRGLRDRMGSDSVSILRKVTSLKSKLDSLDESNTKNRTISVDFREGSTVDRTHGAFSNGFRVIFKDVIHEFMGLRVKIMLNQKDHLRGKYLNVTGEMPTEETVERLMLTSTIIDVFEGRLGRLEVEDKKKNEVMKDTQRNLGTLDQLFLDMAVLIDKQGDQIDDIERNVANAGEFISGGTNSIHHAKQTKKRNGKLSFCEFLGLPAVGFFIVLLGNILLGVFQKFFRH